MADFIFYGTLNDFLPKKYQHKPVAYKLNDNPAIKDTLEAIGVPHPEINLILVNKDPVSFSYSLQENDQVQVYPLSNDFLWPEAYKTLISFPEEIKFVLDVHLGKLAKYLRLLGFDTLYQNNYTDKEIARSAELENRIVLTRDVGLLKLKVIKYGYWLRSQHLFEQLKTVITYYKLANKIMPFTRCITCNGHISKVPKESIIMQLPSNTRQYFNAFYQCNNCHKIYWKGSHYEHMLENIKKLFPAISDTIF